ncbi:hypothetical protein BGZ76_000622 [Entomortierella beljakovae]|nr:hypothetical protein BGZ76_000622 [Entomortierella beljakovae]
MVINKSAHTIVANPQDMLSPTLPGAGIGVPQSSSHITSTSISNFTSTSTSTTTTTTNISSTSPSHPPPVHSQNGQPYNIHQRIRQPNGHPHNRPNHPPSLRQSWLFPTNRASPSTALPETAPVMTRNERPRTEASSSTSNLQANGQSAPPNSSMNHRERRMNSGSARNQLRKINRMSKMSSNASTPNMLEGTPAFPSPVAPRRARLNMQPHTIPVTEVIPTSNRGTMNSSDLSSRSSFISTNSLNTNHSRHVVMPSTSLNHAMGDPHDNDDSFPNSLPSTPAFPPGETLIGTESISPPNSAKATRHSSMPLPKHVWRLQDLPDTEDSEPHFGQMDESELGQGSNTEERGSFQYLSSNASSSTTNLDSHPYSFASHTRQGSASTFYTLSPNASNLDLSVGPSFTDLSTVLSSDSSTPHPPPPLPKAVKNIKSPLALRQRQKVILEILKTERSYVDGLIVLQSFFFEPLNAPYATNNGFGMNTTHSNFSGAGSTIGTGMATSPSYYAASTMGSNSTLAASAAPLLPKKSVAMIFSNFSEILQINIELLTQLETRICGSTLSTGWESDEDDDDGGDDGDDGQEDDDDHAEQTDEQGPNKVWVTVNGQGGEQEELLVLDMDWCVGDIFIEIAPFLKMYSSYVKAFQSARAHVLECVKNYERFAEFLKVTEKRPECKNLDFLAYSTLPIQRIPRYKLLLENLLRHTPVDHPDHRKLQIAFQSMEQTAGFVNETIRQHEMFTEMINLQQKINGMSEPLVIPGRVLLKHGRVSKVCRRNIQPREIILFSDCLVWTSPSLNPLDDTLIFHRMVALEGCTVIGVGDLDPTKNAFQIMSSDKSSQVYVDTPKEKDDWIAAIRKATQDYYDRKGTLKPSPPPVPTLWTPFVKSKPKTIDLPMCVDPETPGGGFGPLSPLDSRNQSDKKQAPQPPQPPLRVADDYSAPIWVPDHSETRCMICAEVFGTIFRRRHHCRACGNLVCHSCSSNTILFKGNNFERVGRACDVCICDMFPEEANMIDPNVVIPESSEKSPIEQQQRGANSDPERRASNQSLDGVIIKAEDYPQESHNSGGATGMVRGIVEAGLNRMKSRSSPPSNQDNSNDSKENSRASNRKSDSHFTNSMDYQNSAHVKECGLCKTEFSMFKWRNICSQCRRVVCSDCLTKKQVDQLFLLGLQAEREARARGVDINTEDIIADLALRSNSSDSQETTQSTPEILQSLIDGAVETSTNNRAHSQTTPRSQSINNDTDTNNINNTNSNNNNNNNGGGGYGSFGNGWRGIRGNTDSGHGHAEKLCDPCYLGLSADQIKVLESGGGWQYYQATMGRHQAPGLAAALALSNMSLEDEVGHD